MPIPIRITVEDVNRSRRAARQEIAAWLRAARNLRRHGQHRHAAFLEQHAADFKAWAGARPIPV